MKLRQKKNADEMPPPGEPVASDHSCRSQTKLTTSFACALKWMKQPVCQTGRFRSGNLSVSVTKISGRIDALLLRTSSANHPDFLFHSFAGNGEQPLRLLPDSDRTP